MEEIPNFWQTVFWLLALAIVGLAGNQVIVALFRTMIRCIVLGMGVSAIAAPFFVLCFCIAADSIGLALAAVVVIMRYFTLNANARAQA